MNKEKIDVVFNDFAKKYDLPPVFQLSDGNHLGGFIISFKTGESFMISFDSHDSDIAEAADMLDLKNKAEVIRDIKTLHALCSAPFSMSPAPDQLQ